VKIQIPDPADFMAMPEWQALHRESMLVRGLLCSAANAVSRAAYADKLGEYYTAFFGFSLGLERLAKLCVVTDYALEHEGNLPPPSLLSAHGHQVAALLHEVQNILTKNGLKPHHHYPGLAICEGIIRCLDAFADAKQGRYANFDALGNPNFTPAAEPVSKWWTDVARPILAAHFQGTKAQERAAARAAAAQAMLGHISLVAYTNEGGERMTDLQSAAYRTAENEIVQKYGRYYSLLLVRWLASSFKALALRAALEEQMIAFFGHWELFYTFTTEDRFLRERRTWPLS
jgi:hypothetical protein